MGVRVELAMVEVTRGGQFPEAVMDVSDSLCEVALRDVARRNSGSKHEKAADAGLDILLWRSDNCVWSTRPWWRQVC